MAPIILIICALPAWFMPSRLWLAIFAAAAAVQIGMYWNEVAAAGAAAGVAGRAIGLHLRARGTPTIGVLAVPVAVLFVTFAGFTMFAAQTRVTLNVACYGQARVPVQIADVALDVPFVAPFQTEEETFGDSVVVNKFCADPERHVRKTVREVRFETLRLEPYANIRNAVDTDEKKMERFCTATNGQAWRDEICAANPNFEQLPRLITIREAGQRDNSSTYEYFLFQRNGKNPRHPEWGPPPDPDRKITSTKIDGFTHYTIVEGSGQYVIESHYYQSDTRKDALGDPLVFKCDVDFPNCTTGYALTPQVYVGFSFNPRPPETAPARLDANAEMVERFVAALRAEKN